MRSIALVAILALAACSSGPKPLAQPDGKLFRFNPEKWAETSMQSGAAR